MMVLGIGGVEVLLLVVGLVCEGVDEGLDLLDVYWDGHDELGQMFHPPWS